MRRSRIRVAAIAGLWLSAVLPADGRAAGDEMLKTAMVVAQTIQPLMERHGVPGMAVGVVTPRQTYVYNFGVASKTTVTPVTGDTLFEIGSITKTFTATLAAEAQVRGKLSLSDRASQYLPALHGSSFDKVSLLNLGTHTAGGLPLQVPDDIKDDAQLLTYLQNWKPVYLPGTRRTYSNMGIGILGVIAAQSLNGEFVALMQSTLFSALGMQHSYLEVPAAQMERYAQGYTTEDMAARMTPGVLGAEAYGVRTTVGDMLRFVQANMQMLKLDEPWQQAIDATHTGYYRLGPMTQALIWEQYHYPIGLKELQSGNSAKVSTETNPVTALTPPLPLRDDVLINKTGSTNGFAAYVAFIPDRKLGVVLLANKNYPIDARVAAAYAILTQLAGKQ